MKSQLSRRQSREQAFLLAFERNFQQETVKDLCETAQDLRDFEIDDFAINLLEQNEKNEDEINTLIEKHANGWALKRISKVSLSVLQLAVSELKYTDMSQVKDGEIYEIKCHQCEMSIRSQGQNIRDTYERIKDKGCLGCGNKDLVVKKVDMSKAPKNDEIKKQDQDKENK